MPRRSAEPVPDLHFLRTYCSIIQYTYILLALTVYLVRKLVIMSLALGNLLKQSNVTIGYSKCNIISTITITIWQSHLHYMLFILMYTTHTHSLIHLHIISGRRQSMQIRMVHRCFVLRISISIIRQSQICHPRAGIDLKLCPGCARTSGVSTSSKGHRAHKSVILISDVDGNVMAPCWLHIVLYVRLIHTIDIYIVHTTEIYG